MKNSVIFLLLLCLFSGLKSSGQSKTPDRFVQFYLPNIENSEKAGELSSFLKSKDGIKMCRVDAVGKTVYIIFQNEKTYTEADFSVWLNEKGYSFTCFYKGIHGVDPYKKMNAQDCASE